VKAVADALLASSQPHSIDGEIAEEWSRVVDGVS
jgi:hypothetical protein